MVQSPSWVANWFAASQEILRISRNLKVHYRTHKSVRIHNSAFEEVEEFKYLGTTLTNKNSIPEKN